MCFKCALQTLFQSNNNNTNPKFLSNKDVPPACMCIDLYQIVKYTRVCLSVLLKVVPHAPGLINYTRVCLSVLLKVVPHAPRLIK